MLQNGRSILTLERNLVDYCAPRRQNIGIGLLAVKSSILYPKHHRKHKLPNLYSATTLSMG